ncbi:hypothetical protein HT594_00064 [Phenacoccus solenopsis nudivirus]|nr:hypothetical protein HT594_00064 [Phenacoccus solenopsis nudivirus]
MLVGAFYESNIIISINLLDDNDAEKLKVDRPRKRHKNFKVKVFNKRKRISSVSELIHIFEVLYERKYTHVVNLRYNSNILNDVARHFAIVVCNSDLRSQLCS